MEFTWHGAYNLSYGDITPYSGISGLLLLRVFNLWDRSPVVWRLIVIGTAITYTISVVFLVLSTISFTCKLATIAN